MADGNSDIGFARLCFVRHKDGIYAICCLVPQGTHTKVLKLSAGLRTQSVECSKLGKTRIIEDAQYVADLIKDRFGYESFLINHVGPTIGAHTGPGVVALFYMGDYR